MRELSVAEQRYQAVQAVIGEGATITEVAARFGVSRQTVHAWLAKYEVGGLEGLGDGSHRPVGCPHQMTAEVEVEIARPRILRRLHDRYGISESPVDVPDSPAGLVPAITPVRADA